MGHIRRFQVSALPPAKQTAGQIEKETNEHRTSNHALAWSNKGILSILIAVANRSHKNLEGSFIGVGRE